MLRLLSTSAALAVCAAHDALLHEEFIKNFIWLPEVGDGLPEQIWINYGHTPDSMVVGWITNSSAQSIVQYDTTPNGFRYNASGAESQYTIGTYTSGYIHSVTLTGLSAATTYTYRIGGPSSGWSPSYSFRSNPGVGPTVTPYRFGVIGDLGQTNNSNATIWHVMAVQDPPVDSVFITGDLSYADGFQPRWDSFGRLMTPLSSTVPVMVGPGNHEIESFPPFEAYNARFNGMPYKKGSADGPQYYSYETGPAHVIVLNSFGIYSSGSPQYTWLQQDLASVNRTNTPWILVILHAPWYNSNKGHQGDGELMRVTLEGLLHDARVAMVLTGHVHAYERSHPVYNNQLDATGAVHITIGDGGNREGLYTTWVDPQPAWSAFRQAEYGHGVLTLLNTTHASWEWHRDVDTEPTVSDAAVIVNPYSG